MSDDQFLNYEQAAELIGVATGTLYFWVSEKKIPHHRLSPRMVRFSKRELILWFKSHQVQTTKHLEGENQS